MQASGLLVVGSSCQRDHLWGHRSRLAFLEARSSRGLWEEKARAVALTGQLKGCSEGAAQCFVLITSEMLTWASLGAARGRPAPRAVEVLLQTARKTQVSSSGGERASGPGKRTFIMPGGRQENPSMPWDLLAGGSGLAPAIDLRTERPASQEPL